MPLSLDAIQAPSQSVQNTWYVANAGTEVSQQDKRPATAGYIKTVMLRDRFAQNMIRK
jgi:hypothetical protein